MHDEVTTQPESQDTTGPVIVPRFDEINAEPVYARGIHRLAFIGGLIGASMLGLLGLSVANGWTPLPHLGQWASGGVTPAAFAGAGVGVALGGLCGAMFGLFRLPRRYK